MIYNPNKSRSESEVKTNPEIACEGFTIKPQDRLFNHSREYKNTAYNLYRLSPFTLLYVSNVLW